MSEMHERALETLGELTTNLAEADVILDEADQALEGAMTVWKYAKTRRGEAMRALEAHKLNPNF